MPKKPIEPDDEDDPEETNDDTADAEAEETDAEEEEEADSDNEKEEGASSAGGFSWDTDDAEAGGLPEGRVVLMNPRTRLASTSNPSEDDDDGYPVLSVICVPVEDGDPFDINLSAGKAARLVPSDDGGSFQPAEGSSAKGLSKSSNCFYFIKSLEDAGFPKDKMRSRGIKAIEGTEVDLTRVPQPKRKGLTMVDDEEGTIRTMPAITHIHSLPWEKKGLAAREAAAARLKGKGKKSSAAGSGKKAKRVIEDEDEDEALLNKKYPKVDKKEKAASSGNGSKDYTKAAETAVMKALKEPAHAKKGLPETDVYPAAFTYAKDDANRKQIMALIKDDDWVRHDDRPWLYDAKLERLTQVG